MKSYITFILLAISSLCYGDEPTNQPYFSGKIKDNGVLNVDSLRIAFFENYLGGAYGVKLQTIKVDASGGFEFRCPVITKPGRLSISVYHAGKGYVLNNYIVESADKVHIIITKVQDLYTAKFSGAGSAKYNLIDQLVRQHELVQDEVVPLELNRQYSINELKLKLQQFDEIIMRAEYEKLSLINRYKISISKTMQRFLQQEYGPNFSRWDTRLYQLYSEIYTGNDSIKVMIAAHFNDNKNRMSYDILSLAPISQANIAFLWEREKLNLYFIKTGASTRLDTFYDIFSSKYTGEMRDCLLARIFLFPRFLQHILYTSNDFESLLSHAYNYINTPYLKDVLSHKFKVQRGTKLQTEDFTDLQGNPFSVKSLLGKVFLLDIWGEGCTGCALFYEKFQAISSDFKKNPEFGCLSISIDKTKKTWLKGIKSGKFTSEDHINVYTGGVGGNHPFLQYYKISAIPFILLVDRNGNIYEKIEVSISSEQLKNLIYEALKENSTK